jgi:hypothetical protein
VRAEAFCMAFSDMAAVLDTGPSPVFEPRFGSWTGVNVTYQYPWAIP